MDISVIETASRLGYDTSLYRPLSESKNKRYYYNILIRLNNF